MAVPIKSIMRNSKPPSKLAMLMVLLFLLCYGVEKVHCSTVHENNQDFHSLLDFKKGITHDPNGAMNDWINNTHFCRWKGVKCTLTPPYRVTELNLSHNNLAGQISSSLGNLTNLNLLALPNNRFGGPIPLLDRLQNLNYLSLDNNSLNGVIPESLANCFNLNKLGLSNNNLTGVIPPNIGSLTKLQVLLLHRNKLSGVIPSSLSNITNLIAISLSENQLNGSIPIELWQMPQLTSLYLHDNYLFGEIPQTLSNVSSLHMLSLAYNMLSNTLPSNFGHALHNLKWLYLEGNLFEGHIPDSLGNVSGLLHLDISSNHFTGKIPSIFGKLSGLSFLNLEENMFEASDSTGWEFFADLATCSYLSEFSLASNNLQGAIPNSIANMSTNLKRLLMSDNHLSGIVPSSIGKFNGLIELDLGGNNFTGTIEDWIPKLTSLQNLYLNDNNFDGRLPDYLNDLKLLNKIDLSYNNFQGEIPKASIFDNATVVSLDGNPGLCGGTMDLHMPSCPTVSRRATIISYLIKILIPIFGFMSLLLLVYFLVLEKKTSRRAHQSQLSFGEHFEKVTYNDLAQATRDFSESNLIGKGSYGTVYSGKLKESKTEVAVKVFDLEMQGAERSFLAECEALRSIQHRNLLPIITACSTVDTAGNVFKALIYELMPNGNLDKWIHHKGDEAVPKRRLSLTQRIAVVVSVADALDYLHHDCGRPTVHCDLKPSNILLDDDMNALLADFGIARLYADPQLTFAGSISSIGIKGTIGYIPPEYGGGGHVSTSGDVYSFGIVLLEILTGKRPTDPMFTGGLDIISFVENSFPDQIFQVIDPHLVEDRQKINQPNEVANNEMYQCLVALLQVALSCTRSLPSERSNMKQVASKLQAIKAAQLGGKSK
ncbi:LRR receptor-like serine/threonine-protein kinase EFR [Zea mays]|uniref:Receptor kinase-like protein Xa21 n=1 Tax=Zea mays TaxID=4577 RepID=A0A1D6Q4X8_MAIZE|nr:LRR receptor-like serine/threonine-protein kinase EFR [Zea mays]